MVVTLVYLMVQMMEVKKGLLRVERMVGWRVWRKVLRTVQL